MQVSRIIISNILGIESLDISPSAVTQVTGQNGTGKSSVISAIQSALKGGHDATLLRNGAEKGEIVLLLDDGTEIKKTVTADKSDVKVKGPSGKGGVGVLDGIRDIVSVNPVEFLTASTKRRLEILLESVNLDLAPWELKDAVGYDVKITGTALETIDALTKAIYDERTGVNRALREKKATLTQLCETVPAAVPGGDVSARIATCKEVIAVAESQRSRLKEAADAAKNAKIVAAAKVRDEAIRLANEAYEVAFTEATVAANQAYEDANTNYATETTGAQQEMAKLQEQLQQQGRFEQQRSIIAQMEKEVEELETEATGLTQSLTNLANLKQSKLANLPIAGIDIREGEIYLNDVPFDRVNSSEQVKFAINIAMRRAGELKLICVDGLELIDPERYNKFIDAVKKADGYQFIVTRVSDTPLSIQTA